MFNYLYIIVDVFSRKIVAWELHETECGDLASQLVRQAVMREGPCRPDILLADNGAIQKSSTLRATLEQLGIEPSYSRPRVSNDNAYSESLFRTATYRPDFPADGFDSMVQAREWVHRFVQWYDTEHRHSAIKFVTPHARHSGADVEILEQRQTVYERAKTARPERWTGKTRDWSRSNKVTLNPDKRTDNIEEKLQEVA